MVPVLLIPGLGIGMPPDMSPLAQPIIEARGVPAVCLAQFAWRPITIHTCAVPAVQTLSGSAVTWNRNSSILDTFSNVPPASTQRAPATSAAPVPAAPATASDSVAFPRAAGTLPCPAFTPLPSTALPLAQAGAPMPHLATAQLSPDKGGGHEVSDKDGGVFGRVSTDTTVRLEVDEGIDQICSPASQAEGGERGEGEGAEEVDPETPRAGGVAATAAAARFFGQLSPEGAASCKASGRRRGV